MFYYNSTHSEPSFQRRGFFFFVLFETMHLSVLNRLYGEETACYSRHIKKQKNL